MGQSTKRNVMQRASTYKDSPRERRWRSTLGITFLDNQHACCRLRFALFLGASSCLPLPDQSGLRHVPPSLYGKRQSKKIHE
jgi:hypothetical protein